MKPAPPVTSRCTHACSSSRLAADWCASAAALSPSALPGRRLVEHAVRGPPRRRRIIARSRSAARRRTCVSRPQRARLFGDRHGEVVPARDAGVGPVRMPGSSGRADARSHTHSASDARRRRADLVGDDAHRRRARCISRSMVSTKLLPLRRIDPGGAHDSPVPIQRGAATACSPASLVRAIDAQRAGRIVRPYGAPREPSNTKSVET